MAEVHARRFGQSGSLAASTAVLAAASIAGKIVGAIYRVPLTNVLGAEGMGLYQTFFPVYALFVTLTSGALPTITELLRRQRRAVRTAQTCMRRRGE